MTARHGPVKRSVTNYVCSTEHFNDHDFGSPTCYFTARVGKIGHNRYEHAISWDFSGFAASREPSLLLHFPGYLPGHDLSEVRDNTWTKESAQGMSRAQVLAATGRRSGLPLSWRATHESPRMTPDGTTANRTVQLMAQNRDRPFFIAAGFFSLNMTGLAPIPAPTLGRRHHASPFSAHEVESGNWLHREILAAGRINYFASRVFR